MKDFSHVETWIFDMDNTLYDAEAHVFPAMTARITDYVARHLGLPQEDAGRLRKTWFHKYGTTLRGLMSEHGADPADYLAYTHDFDISPVPRCAVTRESLSLLPGRKLVFTSAPRAFAEIMTGHLGLRHHFEDIFAIEDCHFWPKPYTEAYDGFLKKHGVDPRAACMFEDMAVNLKPAFDLGMTTVWCHGGRADRDADHAHVHHRTEKLSDWLAVHAVKKD